MRTLNEIEQKFTEQLERSLPNISNEEFRQIWYLGITIFYKGKFSELPKSICKFDNNVLISWKTDFKELIFEIEVDYGENNEIKVHKIFQDVEIEEYDSDKLKEYRDWLYGRPNSQD